MPKFNDNFSKLQSELTVTNHMNTELTKWIVTMERQCWENSQYPRQKCLEVVGVSRQVDDKQLQTKVLSIFKKVGCAIDPTFIDDCHCLGKNNDRVLIKFTCRKDCKQVIKFRKDEGIKNG